MDVIGKMPPLVFDPSIYPAYSAQGFADFVFAELDRIEKERRQRQSKQAKKRHAKKLAQQGKVPESKKQEYLARFKALGRKAKPPIIDEGWESKPVKMFDPSKRKTRAPRGRALYMPYLGHLQVPGNPRQRLWDSGDSYVKPSPLKKLNGGKLSRQDLVSACTTIRADHPGRKS